MNHKLNFFILFLSLILLTNSSSEFIRDPFFCDNYEKIGELDNKTIFLTHGDYLYLVSLNRSLNISSTTYIQQFIC